MRLRLVLLASVLTGCDPFLSSVDSIEPSNETALCGAIPELSSFEATLTSPVDPSSASAMVTFQWAIDVENLELEIQRSVNGERFDDHATFDADALTGVDSAPADSEVRYQAFAFLRGCPDGPVTPVITVITPPLVPEVSVAFDEDDLILSWQDYSTANREVTFNVIRREGMSDVALTPTPLPGTTRELRDPDLPDGTEYTYVVTAIQSASPGISSSSTELSVATRPPAPTNVQLLAQRIDGVTIGWDTPATAANVQVWLEPVADLPAGPVPLLFDRPTSTSETTEASQLTFDLAQLPAGEDVAFEIRARSSSGALSEAATATARTLRPPELSSSVPAPTIDALAASECTVRLENFVALDPLAAVDEVGSGVRSQASGLSLALSFEAGAPVLAGPVGLFDLPDENELALGGLVGVEFAYGDELTALSVPLGLATTDYRRQLVGTGTNPGFGAGMQPFTPTSSDGCRRCNSDLPGQVVVGDDHGCVLDRNGGVWCWGASSQRGNPVSAESFTRVCRDANCDSFLEDVRAMAAGRGHTCAIAPDPVSGAQGAVFCWGRSQEGALGAGVTDAAFAVPVPFNTTTIFSGATRIASGGETVCVIDDSGDVWCWGGNDRGQTGTGDSSQTVSYPTRVCEPGDTAATNPPCTGAPDEILDDARWIGVSDTFACAVASNGTVEERIYCWGDNSAGQLQYGSESANFRDFARPMCGSANVSQGDCDPQPADVILGSGAYRIVDVALGNVHGCAVVDTVDARGELYCWGSNGGSQLGRNGLGSGLPPDAALFAQGQLWADATLVEAHGTVTCATRGEPPQVYCFGNMPELNLANQPDAQPIDVGLDGGVLFGHALSIGARSGCALTYARDGADQWVRGVSCFGVEGDGSDRLGRGEPTVGIQNAHPVCAARSAGQCEPYAAARMSACATLVGTTP